MCHATQYRPRKTDEIRIVGTLSAFDWLDIADGGHKEANHRADDFSPPTSVLHEKGRKRRQAQIKKKKKRKQAIMLLLIC